jgi:hypothetical protein
MARHLHIACAIAIVLVAAPSAPADGPQVGLVAGDGTWVAAPDGSRYTTRHADGDTRLVRHGGGALRIPGDVGLPVVAFDNTTEGVSHDGRTVVLGRPYTGALRSRFAVVRTRPLRLVRDIRLDGVFAYDALSADGRWLYLVEHLAPQRDASQYAVRAYDLRAGRLLPGAIVDPDEAGEPMAGYPLTRTTTRDGRVVYTLYQDVHGRPFVHALDTERRSAECIDFAGVPPSVVGLLRLRLSDDDTRLAIVGGTSRIVVDTATRTVISHGRRDAIARPSAAAPPAPERDATGWVRAAVVAGAVALLAAAAAAAWRFRGRAPQAPRAGR